MEPDKTQSLPKKALGKPSVVSFPFLVLIVIIWVPCTLGFFTNMASVGSIVAICLTPLTIVGLFLAYNSGIALAKANYVRVSRGDLFLPYAVLLGIHILCIGLCLQVSYPFEMCFDICQRADLLTVVIVYSMVSTVLFLPAYYAIYRYRKWVLKYNLPNPVNN